MGAFEQFPYVNMHEMNLEWLLKKMKDLDLAMETFKATESLKFADPIIWDITTQYEKNTIVIDPTGNAYLSLQAVPVGIQLNNDEYWLEIFNFTAYTRTANQNLTINTETNTTRATAAYQVDDWLIWNDVLYRVTSAIAIDDAFIVAPAAGSNIVHFTVEDFIKAFITYATGLINQYKNDIDASELAYKQQLAQDIASTTQSLQAQLNLAISGVTVDSEVINARLGANGITYSTLGEAIRTQVSQMMDDTYAVRDYVHKMFDTNLVDFSTIEVGKYLNINGTVGTNVDFFVTDFIPISPAIMYAVYHGKDCTLISYKSDRSLGSIARTLGSSDGITTPTTGANDAYFRISGRITEIDKILICLGTDYITNKYFDRSFLINNNILAKTGILTDRSVVSDVDNLGSSVYEMRYGNLATNIPDHLPWDIWLSDGLAVLTTIGRSNYNGTMQFLDTPNGNFMRIRVAGSWGPWKCDNFKLDVYAPGSTSQYLTNLSRAIKYAVPFENSVVTIFTEGTYNIKTEFEDMYGANFFSTADFTQTENKGIMLSNNITVKGNPGANIVFDGTGLSSDVQANFSIFNFLLGQSLKGFTLDGIKATAINCRYVVHDDPGSLNRPYKNIYKDCNFKKISTLTNSSRACIGAGLGVRGAIIVDSCIFDYSGGQNDSSISIHNQENNYGQMGHVDIKDSYFLNGTVYLRSIMTPTNKTPALVTNNRFKATPWIASMPVSAGYEGFDAYLWNNIVES